MLWGSHPEKKPYTCLTFSIVSSHWRQLALLSWCVNLCRIEGWQKRATFIAVHDFYKDEKLEQNHGALTHIGVGGGSCCSCGFVPQWGHTPQLWFSISSLLPCWIVSFVSGYWYLRYIIPMASCKWNCFPSGNSKKHLSLLIQRVSVFVLLWNFFPLDQSKHNFFVLCPWAIFSKPVSTLVWTVLV